MRVINCITPVVCIKKEAVRQDRLEREIDRVCGVRELIWAFLCESSGFVEAATGNNRMEFFVKKICPLASRM